MLKDVQRTASISSRDDLDCTQSDRKPGSGLVASLIDIGMFSANAVCSNVPVLSRRASLTMMAVPTPLSFCPSATEGLLRRVSS